MKQQKLTENSARRRDVAPQRVSSQSASNSEHIASKIVCDNLIKPAKNSIKQRATITRPAASTAPDYRTRIPCRLKHHSCCRCTYIHSSGGRPHVAWPRLIAAATAAASTATRVIRKLQPTELGRRAVSLQPPPLDHCRLRRLHAKSGQDPLKTTAGHWERKHINGQNRKYILED